MSIETTPVAEELDEMRRQLAEVSAQLARLEPLLRAALKRAPKRGEAPAVPKGRARRLSEDLAAEVRRRIAAPKKRKAR